MVDNLNKKQIITKSISCSFEAKRENNDFVVEWIAEQCEECHIDRKITNTLRICVEEIFVNVASYAYQGNDGSVEIGFSFENQVLTISFTDSGVEFNPLGRDDPDIEASPEERGIGGLGILLVKKMMDEVTYQRKDSYNVLVLKKNII